MLSYSVTSEKHLESTFPAGFGGKIPPHHTKQMRLRHLYKRKFLHKNGQNRPILSTAGSETIRRQCRGPSRKEKDHLATVGGKVKSFQVSKVGA